MSLCPRTLSLLCRIGFALRVCAALLVCAVGVAQEQVPEKQPAATQAEPTQEDPLASVRKRMAEVSADDSIPEEIKEQALDRWRQAEAALLQAQKSRKAAAAFREAITEAPLRTQRLEAERRTLEEQADPAEGIAGEVAQLAADDLSVRITQERAEAASKKREVDELRAAADALSKRDADIGAAKAAASTRRSEAQQALDSGPAEELDALVAEARQARLEAVRIAATEELATLEQETLSQPMRVAEKDAQLLLASEQGRRLEARVAALDGIATQRRAAEAEQTARETKARETAALRKHPLIRRATEENTLLATELQDTTTELNQAKAVRADLATPSNELAESKTYVEGLLDRAGSQGIEAAILRLAHKKTTEALGEARQIQRVWSGKLPNADSRRFEITIQRRGLTNVNAAVAEIEGSAETAAEPMPPLGESGRAELRARLTDRRDLLQSLGGAYDEYLATLRGLDDDRATMVALATDFRAVLDEWLLWVPDTTPFDVRTLPHGIAWLTQSEGWAAVSEVLVADLRRYSVGAGLFLLLWIATLALRPWLRRRLAAISERTRRIDDDNIVLTLRALCVLFVLAAAIPAIPWVVGWRLMAYEPSAGEAQAGFVESMGAGLMSLGLLALFLGFFRRLLAKGGVGEVHLRWRRDVLDVLLLHLRWTGPVLLLCVFVIDLAAAQQDSKTPDLVLSSGLGRLALIVALLAMAAYLQRVLRPRGAVVGPALRARPNGWAARLRWLWYPAIVGTLLALAGWAAAGYHFTALQLSDNLLTTICVLLAIILVRALLRRWFLIEQRRLAVERFRKQREEARQAAEAGDKQGEASPMPDDFEVGISTINEQGRTLVRTLSGMAGLLGLWFVWVDFLPALGFLENVELWTTGGADGERLPVTLEHGALSVIALIITWSAARNLPGVLEIVILKYLPFEASVRYAITTISRYVLTVLGIIVAFNLLGFVWSEVQWLVAAFSVGLGFGLQEIIANFVCGLILLFERPIRVGDWVRIGQIEGTVSRIRIRATTITDWDRMDLIIPNKELITGQVQNWSLSSSINRMIVNVGVAYGSDTEVARRLLLKVAHDHPDVLEDPAPIATLSSFGDSTLDFALRIYMGDFNNRLGVRHDIHTAIDKAFKEAGIEIAFPQLDLHVKSSDTPVTPPEYGPAG